MAPLPLTVYDLPDLGPYVIHFTGRKPSQWELERDPARAQRWPLAQGRLLSILWQRRVTATVPFAGDRPVTCFTESVPAAVQRLIQEGRYTPHGIAFAKQVAFDALGAPALYVRDDEWDAMWAALPSAQRSRMVRYWPGDAPDRARRSEWLHEREWRVLGDLTFRREDVAFLVTPWVGWVRSMAEQYAEVSPETAAHIDDSLPEVAVRIGDGSIDDPGGFFTGGAGTNVARAGGRG